MISRRAILAGMGVLLLPRMADTTSIFSWEDVYQKAQSLALRPYRLRKSVPADWTNLTYEQYKNIWFRSADALWSDTARPFHVDFFHPGLYFPRPVRINVISDDGVYPFPFNFNLFDKTDKVPQLTLNNDLGYSGFRLRTEFEQPGIKEEFCVFQGASYFRAVGYGQTYGLSARGLSIKTGDPEGEEFPEFVEFWLQAPHPKQRSFFLYALLDSPSMTGAYQFEIVPGSHCVMHVEANLFARRSVSHMGLAPLTSMFLFDETNRSRFDDFRSAVHDSDGLMIRNGAGETLWRPLANPTQLQISAFVDESPRGFGLIQRSRQQSNFADLEALYHRRPSLWVEPKENWGRGSVTLVEIPTEKEIYDNIVAYWRPRHRLSSGEEQRLSYSLTWSDLGPTKSNLPRVLNTRIGRSAFKPGYIAAIDFEDHAIFQNGPDKLTIHIQSNHAETTAGILQRNPETGGLRLTFRFDPKDEPLAEFRAQLRRDGNMASEVWLYRWTT